MRLDTANKPMQTVISSLHIGDLTQVKRISDNCFGDNYLTINILNKIIDHQGVFTKIELGGEIVGFCLAVTIDSLVDSKWFSTEEYKQFTDFPFGVIKTIAIDPAYQNHGLGSKLLESTVLKIEAKYELENLFFPAWLVKNKSRLKGKLIKLGFRFTKELEQYWFNESINQNYQCSNCGNPPCTCNLRLFKKMI